MDRYIARAVRAVQPVRDRGILLSWLAGYSLSRIGGAMGISGTRASYLNRRALAQVRAAYEA